VGSPSNCRSGHGGIIIQGECTHSLGGKSAAMPFLRHFNVECFGVHAFCVNVPVLSEQIKVTEPRVSTACRRRIKAFFLTILRAPKARAP